MSDSFNPNNVFINGIEDAVFADPEGPLTIKFPLEGFAYTGITSQFTYGFLDPVLCGSVEFFKALLEPSSES